MFWNDKNAGLPMERAMKTARKGTTIATDRHGMRDRALCWAWVGTVPVVSVIVSHS